MFLQKQKKTKKMEICLENQKKKEKTCKLPAKQQNADANSQIESGVRVIANYIAQQ